MFEKILTRLKTENKDFGLNQTILEVLATELQKTANTEEEIEAAVVGARGQMKIYQSFADQNRTLAKKLEELEKAKGAGKTDEANDKDEKKDEKSSGDVPEWAKAIIESNKTLTESLTAMKQKEAQQTNAQKLQARLEELKVSKSYLDLLPQSPTEMNFQTDEEIEAFANGLKSKSDAYEQSVSNGVLGQAAKPMLFGEAVKEGDVSPEVQAMLESKKQNQ